MKKKTEIETPFKDIHGETIKVGNIIVFGILGQHWKVSQTKKGDFIITVISNDSGKGYWDEMSSDIDIPENQTEICKEGHYN